MRFICRRFFCATTIVSISVVRRLSPPTTPQQQRSHHVLRSGVVVSAFALPLASTHRWQGLPSLLGRPFSSAETTTVLRKLALECDGDDVERREVEVEHPLVPPSVNRRKLLALSATTPIFFSLVYSVETCGAATEKRVGNNPFYRSKRRGNNNKSSLYVVSSKKNSTTASAIREPESGGDAEPRSAYDSVLSSEGCLLKLLPVKNTVFRAIERDLGSVSVIRTSNTGNEQGIDEKTWKVQTRTLQSTLQFLDQQRSKLQPVFNQEDSTVLEISKAERGERLIEVLRDDIVSLIGSTIEKNETDLTLKQKMALRALADVGELLVESFPYDVPAEGKFSYLPRLIGRAKVTFTLKRGSGGTSRDGSNLNATNKLLGNVTIVADGFAAPITAGNFVDLSIRGFYNGLPVQSFRKRLGASPTLTGEDNIVAYDIASTIDKVMGEDGVVANTFSRLGSALQQKLLKQSDEDSDPSETIVTNINMLGSYQEGFYDPLTAKPRRIPLEVVQFDRTLGVGRLSYAGRFEGLPRESSSSSSSSKPVLTFDIPGLVAMNHPDKNLNGGSSEFFSLTDKDRIRAKTSLMDGQYAPFGYILEGYDILRDLRPGDVIISTDVSEWGELNLVKIRGTSFKEVLKGNEIGG